jgi:DNA repair protein RadC
LPVIPIRAYTPEARPRRSGRNTRGDGNPTRGDHAMTVPTLAPQCRRYRRVAISYMVVRELMDRAWPTISSPGVAADLARELLREHDDDKEHVWVIFLNAQNAYTGHHLVSTGNLSQSIVHPREVLGPALREGAAHLIVIHSHPSGDPSPSKEDLALTRQLADGARLLGLTLHDHLIGASRSM